MTDSKTMEDIFKENRPKLAESSIKSYTTTIKTLQKKVQTSFENPKEFFNETTYDALMKYLYTLTEKRRKTVISAIIVYTDKAELNEEEIKRREDLRKLMLHDAKLSDEFDNLQLLQDKDKDKSIEWSEVINIYNELEKKAKPLFKLKNINKNDFTTMRDYVLLSLYTLIPPRRSKDYTMFKIREYSPSTDNYMDKHKNKHFFQFNQYKLARSFGTQKVDIPNKLKNIIEQWKLVNPSEWLIPSNTLHRVSESSLNMYLNNIFKKPIGVNSLRHSYVSDKYKNINLQELKQVSENMGQSGSVEMLLKYVQRDNNELENMSKDD